MSKFERIKDISNAAKIVYYLHALSKLQVINKGQVSREISRWDQGSKYDIYKKVSVSRNFLKFNIETVIKAKP